MKKSALLAFAAVAFVVGGVLAQSTERQKNQDPGATSKPTADPTAAAAPAKGHLWLKQLAGEWKVTGKILAQPGAPAMESTGTEKVRPLGEYWMITEGQATFAGMPIQSLMTLGFDPALGQYIGSWIDSTNGYMWQLTGTLDAAGKVLTLTADGPSMEDPGKKTKYRDVIEIKGKDLRVMTSSAQKADGTWHQFGTAEKKRVE